MPKTRLPGPWLDRLRELSSRGCSDGHISELLAADPSNPVDISPDMVFYWRKKLGMPARPGIRGFATPLADRQKLAWRTYAAIHGWGHLLPGFCDGFMGRGPFEADSEHAGGFEQEVELSPHDIDILCLVDDAGRCTARDMKRHGCHLLEGCGRARIADLIHRGLLRKVGTRGRGHSFQVIYSLAIGLFRHERSLRPDAIELLYNARQAQAEAESED